MLIAPGESLILTEAQVQAVERAKMHREAETEIETEHSGDLGSQDTYCRSVFSFQPVSAAREAAVLGC
ncbi:MAG: hypothetical protein GYB65_04045 [Chloroflexi bacterium]|nr:hypothetical protein [Chloroflexota bacterium]